MAALFPIIGEANELVSDYINHFSSSIPENESKLILGSINYQSLSSLTPVLKIVNIKPNSDTSIMLSNNKIMNGIELGWTIINEHSGNMVFKEAKKVGSLVHTSFFILDEMTLMSASGVPVSVRVFIPYCPNNLASPRISEQYVTCK